MNYLLLIGLAAFFLVRTGVTSLVLASPVLQPLRPTQIAYYFLTNLPVNAIWENEPIATLKHGSLVLS